MIPKKYTNRNVKREKIRKFILRSYGKNYKEQKIKNRQKFYAGFFMRKNDRVKRP